ncbi:MAG: hypothetical protein B7X11_04370, partial [Acidobacteria bacterium 37-65-4]
IKRVALSTNGARLLALADDLARAGVGAVNVSVDSLEPERFREVTGHDHLPLVLAGIARARELGLDVKLNAVLMKGLNDGEFARFVDLARERPLGVRFIELMPTADNMDFFTARHLKAESLVSWLGENGWSEAPRAEADGPARRFEKPGYAGSVGVIAPYAKDFCATCNRLRVTSRGRLRMCLFAEGEHSLRPLLQHDGQRAERRAGEVGEIQRARLRAVEVEDHRQRHARQQERHQRRQKIQRQPRDLKGKPDQHPQRRRNRERVEHGEDRGPFGRRGHPPLQQMDAHAPQAPPKQRDRDCDKREVVPDGGGVNTGQANFKDETGEGNQEDRGALTHAGTFYFGGMGDWGNGRMGE